VATQTNSETPVLQLANLHNDIVATASTNETVTKLESTYNTTEFGVPTTNLPPKYSWLGAIQLPTELPSGVVAMGARSYVPEIGRFLQPDPRPGGSANAYSYTFGDPLDQADPTGEWTFETPQWLRESDGEWGQRKAAVEAARLEAERKEAERIAKETREREEYYAAINAAVAAGEAARESGGGEEPLGGYEGWACEYAAETGQEDPGCGDGGSAGLDPITYKGGPGATCGSNSTSHRKCHEPQPSKHGEGQEWCELVGGAIGGIFGSPWGVGGSTAGSAAGAIAGKEACKE
jgi:RHS repeat-associated protein